MIGATRPFELSDLTAAIFRPEDEAECLAAGGGSCAQAIADAFHSGAEVKVVLSPLTGTPFAYFGMTEYDELSGAVWMLGTADLGRNARTLAVHTARVIDAWHLRRPVLFNHVDARNALHIRWLKRCGFTFIKLHPRWGHQQLPFFEFVRIPHV